MKECRKVCSFRFPKKIYSTKIVPEIKAEIPRMLYVVHTTFLENQENSYTHMPICFLNFRIFFNIIDFLNINFSLKCAEKSAILYFQKKLNFAKILHMNNLRYWAEPICIP